MDGQRVIGSAVREADSGQNGYLDTEGACADTHKASTVPVVQESVDPEITTLLAKHVEITPDLARRERIYQMTMSDARKLVDEGAITPEQYLAFETKMVAKYRPVFGRLFSELGND